MNKIFSIFIFFISVPFLAFSKSSDNLPVSNENVSSSRIDPDSFEPWFTGPLLAPAARVVPAGHTNWQPYVYLTENYGIYGQKTENKNFFVNPLTVITHGLTSFMDFEVIPQFFWNFQDNKNDFRYGDTTVYLGFQALRDKKGTLIPDLRITLKETFPSGHYQYLNPEKHGTDSSGSGSFQTGMGFSFQKLLYFHPKLLRVRWAFGFQIPSKVHVHSFNSYGGGYDTDAVIKPGLKFAAFLSGEYTLTQKIVLAMDIQFNRNSKNTFKGKSGINSDGTNASLGGPFTTQLSIAPALEYNFNKNVGFIGGAWFTVMGKNSHKFISGVLSVNIYI